VLHAGGRPNYDLMLDIISYLRDYSDRVHHPREDVAFERLARRCPELAPALARLHQEHQVIAEAGEALRALLVAATEDAMLERTRIVVAAAMYLVYYGNHIAREEEEIVGRADRELGAEDWQAVRAAAPARDDPVFGSDPAERYRALRRQIALES
jgi:hemerythrin-like domain-containing protein